MKGRKQIMEKLVHFLVLMGVTLVVAGTVTACAVKDTAIKDAATSVETPVEKQDIPVKAEEDLRRYEDIISEELENEEIEELSDSEIELETIFYWEKYKEVLNGYITNGLDYKTFCDIYSLYRVGNEDVISADDAYQMTFKEIERRYAAKDPEAVDIGFQGNITENEDGTYEYAEQFMAEMRKRPYFDGASDEEIITFLDEVLGYFDGVENEIDAEMMDAMLDAFDGGNLHEENLVIAESESGETQDVDRNNSGSGTTNNQSGNKNNQGGNTATQQNPPAQEPEVITDPNYTPNIGKDSPFSGAITGDFGGGPSTDIDLNLH